MIKRLALLSALAILFFSGISVSHASVIAQQNDSSYLASSTDPFTQTYHYYIGTNLSGRLDSLALRFNGNGNNWLVRLYCRTESGFSSSNCGNFGGGLGLFMDGNASTSANAMSEYTATFAGGNNFVLNRHYFFSLSFSPEPIGDSGDYVNFPTFAGSANPDSNLAGNCVASHTTLGLCDKLPDPYFILNATPAVTVEGILTKETRPTLMGSTTGVSVSVSLNNKHYITTPTTGAWALTLPPGDELTDGDYVAVASSTDSVGNISDPATSTIAIDTLPPVLAVTAGPADDGYASSTAVSLAFAITDAHPDTTDCSFDDTATTTCSTGAAATLADGGHKFNLGSKDKVGNASYKSKHFTVDTVAPVVTVDSRITNELAPVITGNAGDTLSGVQSVSIVVNGVRYNAVVSGSGWSATLTGSSLAEGVYAVTATAKDRAGNLSAEAAGTLTIDRTAPTLAITSGFANGAFTNMTSATFAFTSNAATVCSLDGGDLGPCTSTYTASSLGSGTHLFTVSATDEAGNTTTLTRSWNVDTAAPILHEVAIATTTSDLTPSYTFSSSKAGTIIYAGACTSTSTAAVQGDNTVVFGALAAGTYGNCTVTVVDSLGNRSAALNVTTFTITPVAPPKREPRDKDECKVNGWRNFLEPSFKNQGQCVSYVESHKHDHDDENKNTGHGD